MSLVDWKRAYPWRFRAYVFAPLIAGLLSVLKGQDGNWDLRNYHLYNPWAWLDGRLSTDLAPAGLQSYFNPLIDVPYYVMIQNLPAPVAGFLMGALHGLMFIPAFLVAKAGLEACADQERTAFWLSVAGCLSIGTLAGLGNTMGDNLTAVVVLSAVAVLVTRWRNFEAPTHSSLLWAGALLGLAVGLKLTNAIYVGAACAALLFLYPGALGRKLLAATLVGSVSVAIFLLVAGFWHLRLWQEFGNPLFPQFNALFGSPVVAETMVADRRWQPDGWLEALVWPVLISIDPSRVGDKALPQIALAVVYLLGLAWLGQKLVSRWKGRAPRSLEPVQGFLLGFMAIAFVIWVPVFGIYRYLIPLEPIVVLAIWILGTHLWPERMGRRIAFWLVIMCTIYAVAHYTTWGVRPWAMEAVRVEAPRVSSPSNTVFLLTDGEPMSWMIPWLDEESTYMSLGRMPEAEAYVEKVRRAVQASDGAYVLVYTHHRMGAERVDKLNRWLESRSVSRGDRLCGILRFASRFTGSVDPAGPAENGSADAVCQFDYVKFSDDDLARMNRMELDRTKERLAEYGIRLQHRTCQEHMAYLGAEPEPYRVCKIALGD